MTALLGPGSRVTEVRPNVRLTLRGPHHDEDVNGRVLDLDDPLARGLVRFRAGRAPQQPGRSPSARRRCAAWTCASATPWRSPTGAGRTQWWGGGVPRRSALGRGAVSGAVPPTGPEPDSVWLVDAKGGVDAATVSRLNDQGRWSPRVNRPGLRPTRTGSVSNPPPPTT
ncbi:hypothetical protein NKG94_25210 [Micromonospora sp. M12]